MKKRFILILTALLGVIMLCAPGALAATEGGFTYIVSSNAAMVTAYSGTETEVVIPDTLGGYPVTKIGGNAFQNASFTSVTLPDSVTNIGSRAFYGCTGLTQIALPEGLTTISSYAFYNCTGLTRVNIPGSVKTIGIHAFAGCLNLRSVTLNEGIEEIGYGAFYDCTNLPSIDIPASVKTIDSYAFGNCLSLASLTLREGLETINDSAFYRCQLLTSVSLPSTLTTFSGNAFYNTAIKEITLPENITSYTDNDDNVRYYVAKDSTTALAMATKPTYSPIPFTDPQWPNLSFYYLINEYTAEKTLQLYKYYGTDETSVTLPDFITGIYQSAFYHYSSAGEPTYNASLEEIRIPASVTSIGTNAFYACSALKRVYLPDNITSFGNYIASTGSSAADSPVLYCSKDSATAKNITTTVYRYGFTDPAEPDFSYAYEGDALILSAYHGTDTDVVIPGGISAVGDRAFYENKKLTSVVVPEGVTEIRDAAFQLCDAMTSVTFPSTLTTIGSHAFNGSMTFDAITLPDALTTLGSNSLLCTIGTIYLPDNITTVGTYPFYDSVMLCCKKGSVTAYNVSAKSTSYRLCDPADPDWKYRYNDDGGLVFGGYLGSETKLTIPDIYVGISDYAFSDSDHLTKIVIPESVTSLGYSALSCNAEEIYLPDNITTANNRSLGWGNSIFFINKDSVTMSTLLTLSSAFTFCDPSDPDWLWQYSDAGELMLGGYRGSATSITLPAGVTAIADSAFDHDRNDNIVSITIPEGYTSIGYRSLSADNLAHVSLPSTLRSIGNYAFSGCEFSMIQLPEGLETIGKYAFNSCYRMTSLTIPSTVTNISSVIARYCDSLTTVVLPAEIEYIAPGTFGDALSTVYCYRGTYAQEWAKENSPLVRLIGEGTLEDLVTLVWRNGYADDKDYKITEVGRTAPFMGGVTVGTMPLGASYTFTCVSSDPSVARVDDDILTFLKPGTVTITVAIAERPDVAPIKRTIEVYNPVTDFTVPEAVFVHIDADDPAYLIPENIEPTENANPYFRRRDVGNGWWGWQSIENKGVRFLPEERLGAIKCEIESFSGIIQPILFVTYDVIGEVYAYAPARPLVVGQIWEPDVTVMVDGAELKKLSYLYTLKTSNAKVAAITEDEMIRAVAPGTATITVTARNSGKTAKFTVTVTEAVTLNLPAALTAVSEEAFIGVSASEVVIPEGCTSIGARAFADCANLESVTIPASVTDIAEDAFSGCSGVTVTTPAGSAAAQMFEGMDGFTVLTE